MKMKMKLIAVMIPVFFGLSVEASQTNVLLIIADDLGYDCLSVFNDDPGADQPPTPTIDNLYSNGIAFTRYYAYSTCSPTRASILTGRYSFRSGVISADLENTVLSTNEFTLPDALIESGVISNRMASIGKWHLGSDPDAPNVTGGWPHFSGALGGGVGDYYNWSKTVNGVTTSTTTYSTTVNVNDSVQWINQQGTNSWFLWLAFNAPHVPHHRPPWYLHSYSPLSEDGENDSRRHYNAMVEAMDTEMGRLLGNVDLSNTTVIFMGDNGTISGVVQPPFPSDHSKGAIYEGGVRVPMIITGAAVSNGLAGSIYDGVLHSVDLYATILQLFGVRAEDVVPEALILDSRSFAPVLSDEAFTRNPVGIMVQNETADTGRAIIEGGYKLIAFDNGTQECYNVALDLAETNNLFGTTNQPAEVSALQAQLTTYTNIPNIYSVHMDTNNQFNAEIGWFSNEGFTLWRTEDLVSNVWNEVAGQELIDTGESILILRDPSPPATSAFYRVSTP